MFNSDPVGFSSLPTGVRRSKRTLEHTCGVQLKNIQNTTVFDPESLNPHEHKFEYHGIRILPALLVKQPDILLPSTLQDPQKLQHKTRNIIKKNKLAMIQGRGSGCFRVTSHNHSTLFCSVALPIYHSMPSVRHTAQRHRMQWSCHYPHPSL